MVSVVIENYLSDGPGFGGRIEISLEGNVLTQKCSLRISNRPEDTDQSSIILPISPNEIVHVTDLKMAENEDVEAARILDMLELEAREYFLNDPRYLSREYTKLLKFSDGQQGFLIVYGECDIVSFAIGNKAFECSNDESCGYCFRNFRERNIESSKECLA